jgi:hypothetical protein
VKVTKCKFKFPVWFSYELKQLIIEKKKAHVLYKCSGELDHYEYFAQLRELCKVCSRNCYDAYVNGVASEIDSDPRRFWSYINSLRKVTALPEKMSLDGAVGMKGCEISNLFADFFSTVYKKYDNPVLPDYDSVAQFECFTRLDFSIIEVFEGISRLPLKYSSGPDGIPSALERYCVHALAHPSHHLFNRSLSSGIFPTYWKDSYITPISKSGDILFIYLANANTVCLCLNTLLYIIKIKKILEIRVPTTYIAFKNTSKPKLNSSIKTSIKILYTNTNTLKSCQIILKLSWLLLPVNKCSVTRHLKT